MADVRLEPMTETDFATYRETAEEDYAQQVAESGAMSLAEAREKATADFVRLLPGGLSSPDQFFWLAHADDVEVGMIWLNIAAQKAYIFDIVVREDQRRHGYGRAIMRAAEDVCRTRGVTSIGLNVFAQNAGARKLYEQEGYETTSLQMRKLL
ncbi:GNAT family N-acetyltransferase [Actinoplanes sp. NPDC051859]|uniref:GNAT family N-acetyltransferase n=1 Tax=Actinoplanes sp. NPDC051859 TaxID=3363909 RepID=UPI0037B42867